MMKSVAVAEKRREYEERMHREASNERYKENRNREINVVRNA